MYLRTTERRNKDGSVVRYLALAHNQRVGATTKANVLLNLGREDRLDPDGLRRLVRSINRYLGEPDAGTDAAESAGADTAADGLRLIASRPVGAAWLLHGLWQALDVDTALRKVLGGRRFTTDVERVLFALVANRAIDPSSKLAAAEWASHDVAIPGLDGMGLRGARGLPVERGHRGGDRVGRVGLATPAPSLPVGADDLHHGDPWAARCRARPAP